jgi:phosphoribosyl-ATP pyrophosphohydrolase
MSDSLERLYQAVIAARDLDPATSRTARLFQRGPSKMAKKLAEEAIEVVIDAVNGKTDAVVRESADLLYNLTVLWASAGVNAGGRLARDGAARGYARHRREAAESRRGQGCQGSGAQRQVARQGVADKAHGVALRSRRRIVALEGRSCVNGTNSSRIPSFSGMDKSAA